MRQGGVLCISFIRGSKGMVCIMVSWAGRCVPPGLFRPFTASRVDSFHAYCRALDVQCGVCLVVSVAFIRILVYGRLGEFDPDEN